MAKSVVKVGEIPEENFGAFFLQNYVSRSTVGSRQVRAGICTLGPGEGTTLHSQPAEEVFFILKGEGTFEVAGEVTPFLQSDFLYVSEDVDHQIVNTGDGPLQYLFAVVPAIDPSQIHVVKPFRRPG